jgi:hypothetical protein
MGKTLYVNNMETGKEFDDIVLESHEFDLEGLKVLPGYV